MKYTIKKILVTFLGILYFSLNVLNAQTITDSLIIASAQWTIETPRKGLTCKYVLIPQLYNGPQAISLIEIDPAANLKVGIAFSKMRKKTSEMASEHGAIAAINGSYFNMKRNNSVCFLKIDDQVIDTTTTREFQQRVTGAVYVHKGKVQLLSWNKQIEKKYKKKKGTILASGPLLLRDGKVCDWSVCTVSSIHTKHPRSVICKTKKGTVMLVTVDGRFPTHAAGMNIQELTHLVRVLGGVDALNLDGGGSTTLWLDGFFNNGIVNHPSDNKRFDHMGEREVSNILYIYD